MKLGPYETHPAADVVALMPDADLRALADSITQHGLDEPIVLYQGRILDGRNRYLACGIAEVEPRFSEFAGSEAEAIQFAERRNRRRHMTPDQAALARRRWARLLAAATKTRRQRSLPVVSEMDGMADRVEAHPLLAEAVERGDLELHVAAAVSELSEDQQRAVLERLEEPDEPTERAEQVDTYVVESTLRWTARDVAALKTALPAWEHRAAPEFRHAAHLIRHLIREA
jgi:ParB-like chromosome segregation protein Spo0J